MKRKLIIICGLFLFVAGNRAMAQHLQNGASAPHMQKTIKPGSAAPHMAGIHIQNFTASCSTDTILLTSQSQINNYSTTYATCTTPNYLIIDGAGASPAITSLAGLSSVTAVVKKLQVTNTSIVNLSQMTGLVQVDTLDIRHNALMTGVGLNNLTYLGDIFFVDLPVLATTAGLSNHIDSIGSVSIDSTALTNLNGLSNITRVVTNGFGISHSPITDFDGLNLHQIWGYFYLDTDTLLTHIGLNDLHSCSGFLFSNLSRLTSIANLTAHLDNGHIGTFWMIQTKLQDLTGLSGLTGSSNFYVWLNDSLKTFNGLQNISGNVDGISIWFNNNVDSVTQLSHITSLNQGTLEFHYMLGLNSLNGIQNITHIKNGLWVVENPNLDTLSLNNNLTIDNDNGDNVKIFGNDVLAVCASTPICNYLAGGGVSEIHDNASGCASVNEIIAQCTNITDSICADVQGADKYWLGTTSTDWNDANNWSPSGVPDICNKVFIPDANSTNHSPVAGSNIFIAGLDMADGSVLDMQSNNITVSRTLRLDNAEIDNGAAIRAVQIFEPNVNSSTIHGNFSCLAYWGSSNFVFNNFYGNTAFSDSSIREDNSNIFLNQFHGNLACTDNADYGNFYLANASPDFDYISGNLTLTNNSEGHISVGLGGDRPIKVDGNITANVVNGNIDFNTITLSGNTYTGNTPHITYTGPNTMQINRLYVERGIYTIVDQNIYIQNELGFEGGSGVIYTTPAKRIILGSAGTAYSYSGFVNGPMTKIGNTAFTFPIGKIENNTFWGPADLSISAPADETDQFTAEYFRHNPAQDGYDTSHHTADFNQIRGNEYWNLTRDEGISNVTVTLAYDTTRSGYNSNYQSMQIGEWDGSLWHSWGTGGYTGDFYRGHVVSGSPVTQFGPLAFSYKPLRKPVITMSAIDTIHCQSDFFYVPFTLDTLAIANNSYHVEVSDTAGNFSTFFNPGLGSKFTNHSDSINCFVPNFGFYGKPYKIRIVGSSAPDTSINTRTVVFLGFPTGYYIVTPTAPTCQGTTVKYYPSVAQAFYTHYSWSVDAGGTIVNTVGDTAYIQWATTGSHVITLRGTNTCFPNSNSTAHIVVLAPAPTSTPVINNSGRWIYASQAPAGNGYQWFRNGLLISGATNSSYYAALSGNYAAAFTVTCGNGPASNIISFSANALAQTITFPQPPDRNYGDVPFVPAATASSGLPVSFTLISGPAIINAQTNAITVTGTGSVTIRASQSGDNTYDTAAPVTRTFTVNKAAQTISFATIADQDISNNTIQLTAASNSGFPVSFSVVSGPATVSGSVLTLTGIGTVTVKASQAGDNNYLAAPDVNRSFCSYVTHLGSISGYTNLCPGTAAYSVNNITGATYLWRIAGGSTLASTTNTANATWPAPGDYLLIVSATGNCGAASANDTLPVHVISSILPDSVHNMLPADGAINQQLPLTLSWVPAQPGTFYTFDLYLWAAEQAQPSTPYAAGLTTVTYTIPVNSGLIYNHPYKWMVVAHNGSCTVIHTGPVQQFSLIPLPDLIAGNVQAPATAFSGQTISINWTVSNPGPGKTTTNQSWTDAVFLSFNNSPNFGITPQTNAGGWSQLDFPVRPLLIGTKPNVTALDPGQQYTNSVSFTLPVNYSQPLYAYVITNYPAGTNAPVQVTNANDTAFAAQPIAVTLSPTPDLRVDTVFTPSTTFSGSTVSVTYKVKNYGVLTPAGSAWNDKIYISQSPIFDINTAIPVKFPKANGTYYGGAADVSIFNNTQLQADSSYTKSVNIVIPNYIFGQYFIYVITNKDQSMYEGALVNNNINSNVMQVFLTPTPHLTVNTLTVPVTTASVTQPVSINWNIFNTGFNDNIEKNKGHYFVFSGNCLIPPPPCGCTVPNCICPPTQPTPGISFRDSTSFGGSSWTDRLYISPDSTGLNANAIQITNTTQGTPNSGGLVPDNYVNFYADGCKQIGTNGSQWNLNTSTVITPNGNYPNGYSFPLPDYLAPGNYWIYVYTNATKAVYEYPGNPEVKRSALPIVIQRPDAIVSGVTAPATATGAQPITISYAISNNGPGKVFNHLRNDNIYASASPVFDGTAQLIATKTYQEDLPVNTPVTHSFTYSFPVATNGTRYIYVHTNFDSSFRETNSANNISAASAPIAVSPGAPADLIVSSIQLADSVYTAYNTFFKYTVPNNGTGTTAGTWIDSVFISCNPLFNSNTNIYIGRRQHSDVLSPGGSYSDSFNLSIPLSYQLSGCFTQDAYNTAYFFIKTNSDNGVYEGSNTNNNITYTGSRVLVNPLVDQIVTTVSGADTATVGRSYTGGWTVKNNGVNPGYNYYSSWFDALYFSPDSVLSANAVRADYYGENSVLNHNATYNDLKNPVVPNIPTGDYYFLVTTNAYNGIAGERNIINNTNALRNGAGAAKKVHVIKPLLPDLIDSILSYPSLIATGQPITVIHRVTNNGPGATYPSLWSQDLWLSADFVPANGNDILLSGKTHTGALLPGAYYDDTVTVTVALNTAPANYVLISRVNAGFNIFETNTDNDLAFKYTTVYTPAPSDLIVESISKPDTVYLGYEVDTAKWVIKNNSPNTASGFSSDGVYLSHSMVLDSTAILLGIKNKQINMGPLSRDTIKVTPVINNVTEGLYHVLVKTDLLNNIVETNKNNNVTAAATDLYVNVKELPLAVQTPNTLYIINRYYKFIIPDSLNGATIRVRLKSNDSLIVKNQLFIAKGYIPSAANFDYTYVTPNYGNQDIVMAYVTSGVYYITVHCATPNPPLQNITLYAEKLPFLITGVQSASGGNIGNVTIKIDGSLFTNNMTAKLSRTGTTINASAVYFTNSTAVYATFNLQGKPLGLYDVTLIKLDSTAATAVLTNGFSIVAANNGGLNNGGGTNTGAGDGTMPGCDPGAAGGINSQLVTELVIPEKVFGGWVFVIQINYSNPTNSDIPAQVRTLYSVDGLPMALTSAGAASGTTALTLQLTEQNGPPGIIRAGGSGTITLYSIAPITFPAHKHARFYLK